MTSVRLDIMDTEAALAARGVPVMWLLRMKSVTPKVASALAYPGYRVASASSVPPGIGASVRVVARDASAMGGRVTRGLERACATTACRAGNAIPV